MSRFLFVFGVWTSILSLVAVGTVNFVGLVPADWVPMITKWALNLVVVNTTIQTALQGYPSAPKIVLPEGAKRAFVLVLMLGAFLFSGHAFAGDIAAPATPIPTKAPVYSYPTTKCGGYYGLDTKGSTGSVSNSAVGTQMVQGAIGITIGYTCPAMAGYWYVDADFDFANLNGSQNGLSLSGPAVFEQRFGFGVPIDMVISLVPGLSSLTGALPSLAPLPAGTKVVTSNPNIYVSSTFDDVGAKFGLQDNRAWLWAANFGLANKTRLSNGVVMEPYVEYMLPNTQTCLGIAIVGGCLTEKNRIRAGLKLEF